jgi:hypothetical protein
MYASAGAYQQSYNKNMQQYPLSANYGFVQAPSLQQQQMFYNANIGLYGAQRQQKNQMMPAAKLPPRGAVPAGYQKNNGYQLKVGGVVVGSWANGSRNLQQSRMNRAGMVINLILCKFNNK